MSFLPTAMIAVAGVTEAVGGIMSANSQYDAAKYNAGIDKQQADLTRQSAQLTEYQARKSLRQTTGTQRAMFAKSGVTFSGSVLDVMKDTIMEGELSIAADNYNSEIQARSFESSAAQRLMLAKQDRQLAYVKSGVSLLKTGAEFGQKMNWGRGTSTNRDINNIEDYVTGKKTRIGQ